MRTPDTDLIPRRSRRLLSRSRRRALAPLSGRRSRPVRNARRDARRAVRDAAGAVREAADSAASSARDAAGAVRDAADSAASSARDAGGTVSKRTKRAAHKPAAPAQPIAQPPAVVEVKAPAETRRSRPHLVTGLAKVVGRTLVLAFRNAPLIAAGAAGAAVSYLLDPESGRRRREETAERIAAAAGRERGRITPTQSAAQAQTNTGAPWTSHPPTAARKVETEHSA
jgi:hypothetical protein